MRKQLDFLPGAPLHPSLFGPHSEAIARRSFAEPVRSFRRNAGAGLKASVAGREIWMGSAAWLGMRKWSSRTRHRPTIGSVVHVAINGQYRGALCSPVPCARRRATAVASFREL